MSKMKFYDEAESLYINDELSLDEISVKTGVSRRTFYYWMAKYKWNNKKHEIIKSQKALSEELFEFCRNLMHKIKNDIELNAPPNRAELYSLVNILKYLPTLQKNEACSPQENKERKGLTPEVIAKIQKDVLGF